MTISTSISFSSITISNISHLEVYRMAAPYNKKHWVLSQYALSSLSKQPNSRYWHKSSFWAFWVIQKCIFVTFEWSSMCHIVAKLFEPSFYNHNMHYQVDPRDQTPDIGPNRPFTHFGSFKIEWSWCKIWQIRQPYREHYVELSKYAIWSQSYWPNLRKWLKTGQNRSFCTNVTVLLHDPDAKTVWYNYQIVTTI